jgi:hypothetical protein
MENLENWPLQQHADQHQGNAERGIKIESANQHTIDAFEIFVRIELGNVFHEYASEIKEGHLAWIERADKHAHEDPSPEVMNTQMQQNVRRQQQRQDETPASSQEVEKCVGNELLGKLSKESDVPVH